MPTCSEITYFGTGPALPAEVLELAAQALVDYQHTGLGIAEHKHRSEMAAATIINEAKADLATFLDIPTTECEVLFMQDGGAGGFSATLYNMVGAWVARQMADVQRQLGGVIAGNDDADDNAVAVMLMVLTRIHLRLDYIVTGQRSLEAYEEAVRLLGHEYVNLAADARRASPDGKAFGALPDPTTWRLSPDPAMVYYCDDETVEGVEFPSFPAALEGCGPVVVADMSSNILSRRVDARKYGVFFFDGQQNLGSTGITVAVVRRDLLPPVTVQPPWDLMRRLRLPVPPIVFSYEVIAKNNNSVCDTLSIFHVYIAGQVLKRLLRIFPDKVDGQQKVAEQKAQVIYAALEAHPGTYRIVPGKSARSRMNICFRVIKANSSTHLWQSIRRRISRLEPCRAYANRHGLTHNGSIEAEKVFLEEAASQGLTGLKGHSIVGGIRASNCSLEGAEKLAKFIDIFARVRLEGK